MATANLSVESKDFTLPVVEATAGADGIVVSTLRNDGWVTLDPGFLTTAQCESKITYIDGKNSILRYRGYPIEQLCEQSDFLEVAWLLRHGELPNKDQYDRFISDINHRTMVGEDFRTFMGSFPRTAHTICRFLHPCQRRRNHLSEATQSVQTLRWQPWRCCQRFPNVRRQCW